MKTEVAELAGGWSEQMCSSFHPHAVAGSLVSRHCIHPFYSNALLSPPLCFRPGVFSIRTRRTVFTLYTFCAQCRAICALLYKTYGRDCDGPIVTLKCLISGQTAAVFRRTCGPRKCSGIVNCLQLYTLPSFAVECALRNSARPLLPVCSASALFVRAPLT